MRFMLIVKATENSEVEKFPNQELMDAMTKYVEELIKAGVHVMAEGLQPSSNGIRISYPVPGGKPVVTNGPFVNVDELVAGFIIIDVKSKKEAIEWAMRMPDPTGDGKGQIEVRQFYENN